MFNLARVKLKSNLRRFSAAINRRHTGDEGDWAYSTEWWDIDSSNSRTIFREVSHYGNGVVSVRAHPSSKPDESHWARTEKWLEQRYTETSPGRKTDSKFRVSGYEWRTLHFNKITRQSTVKIFTAHREEEPNSQFIMQRADCLAIPYVKSMISVGLATISSCNHDLVKNAVDGKQNLNILCIGHGGGSIPLFLASKIRGAIVHIVEIDPVVISASIQAMGFPAFSVMTPSGKRARPKPNPVEDLLWKGTHERLLLFNSDAEKFILDSTNIYDLIFIDAYDGKDDFPDKLCDPHSPFLQALGKRLHLDHGTVVVNLHSEDDPYSSSIGRHTSQVCRSYRDALLENEGSTKGFAFRVLVPWVCNTSLVVCRGGALGRPDESSGQNVVLNSLVCGAVEVSRLIGMPFPCLEYVILGFIQWNKG
ncbi:hypothetical protein CASFOL_030032 [Castilleja foliolosa]|uniref:S-adenosyl-L-methionine-dependent methyltransferase superfamily protein n=1 Tax=Castilleja foliolosa TaxID=1961234 RepID=A0ABD3C9L0_9LAMI